MIYTSKDQFLDKIDWVYAVKLEKISIEGACALSVGIEPRHLENIIKTSEKGQGDAQELASLFVERYQKRLILARSMGITGDVDLATFAIEICAKFSIEEMTQTWRDTQLPEAFIELGIDKRKRNSSKAKIDWDKWGKMKTILLHDACGLLAGIDLLSQRAILKFYNDEIIKSDSNNLRLDHWNKRLDDNIDSNLDEMFKLEKILSVVQNHINAKSFINIDFEKVNENKLKAYNIEVVKIPEGKDFALIPSVKLAEFGSWAKKADYELPPEFPTTDESPTEFFKTSGLINGQFFYESRLRNGWKRLDNIEQRELSAEEYLDKLDKFCEDKEITFNQGLKQLIGQIHGDLTNNYFKTLYETAKERLNDPTITIEPLQAAEKKPKPTQKQNNYYETLTPGQKAKLTVIIQAHENLGIKAKKKDIYNECRRINPDVINEKFESFESNTWITLNKSGRNPKLNSPP